MQSQTRVSRAVCGALLGLVLSLAVASAQGIGAASIVGIVRDTSGAVLPGVTVEASSPVLIERVRSAVTDSDGRYQIAELRPGAYAVTFTLPGFSSFKREGLELSDIVAPFSIVLVPVRSARPRPPVGCALISALV
jgi:hypothetical protein